MRIELSKQIIENVKGLKEIFPEKEFKVLAKEQMNMIAEISGHVSQIKVGVDNLLAAITKAKTAKNSQKMAELFCSDVIPLFDSIRDASDALEMVVDDELWPMTKYRELLFTR